MYLQKTLILLFLISLSGCATVGVPPTKINIEKSRTYSAPYDEVWSAIIAGIAESNLGITTLEKDSGIIALSNITYEPNWANEGTRGSVLGVPDQVMERIANFNIFATRLDSDKTKTQVNSSFKMKIRRGNGSQAFPFIYEWQQAYSNGTLEQLILDGVERRIEQKRLTTQR